MKLRTANLVCLAALSVALMGCKSMHSSEGVNTSTSATTSSTSRTNNATSGSNTARNTQTGGSARSASAPTRTGNMSVASMAFPTGDPDTSAVMLKKMAPVEVTAGSEFEYQIVVQNLTDISLDNVRLTESIPGNFKLTSAQPRQASFAGGSAVWNLGSLTDGASKTITVKGTATNAEPILTCSSVAYNSGICMSVPVVAPALQLLAAGPNTVSKCEDIIYSYEVKNTGTGVARNVTVNVPLASGLMDANGKSTITRNIGNLNGGQSKKFNVKVNAKDAGVFEHTAVAQASNNLKATATPIKTVATESDLTITATGAKKVFAGRDLKYTVEVANPSAHDATDVVVVANVPSGSKFKRATMNGKNAGNKVTWNLGTIPAKGKKALELRVQPGAMGNFTSRFTAEGYCVEEAVATVSSNVTGIPAILLEVVDLEDPILVGDNVTYRITVTNQGTADGHDIKIACQLPGNASFVSGTGDTELTPGAGNGGSVVFQPLASLAPKAKAVWNVTVKGNSPADARYKVSMTSRELTTPVEETEATNFYE